MENEHEERQVDEHAGEQQPDAAGTETGPIPVEPVSPDSPGVREPEAVPVTDPTSASIEETHSNEDAASESPAPQSSESSESSDEPQGEGLLAGTASEQAPGVGGLGDHPAPAAIVGEDGQLHVAGEPPAGTIASGQAPVGDAADEQSGDVTDEEARERLNAVQEPEQIETDRPDIGTQ